MNIFDLFKKIESESQNTAPISFLVAGLGNPGLKYDETRHNAGFLALDYLSRRENLKLTKCKFKSLYCEWTVGEKRGIVIAPQTFMNASGEAVREAADFYKIPPERIYAIFDDISLPVGKIRVRKKGSDGGQKGARSMTEHLGTEDFPRIKIGVGAKPHPDMELADWVLSKFNESEKKELFGALEKSYDALKLMIAGDIEKAMALYN